MNSNPTSEGINGVLGQLHTLGGCKCSTGYAPVNYISHIWTPTQSGEIEPQPCASNLAVIQKTSLVDAFGNPAAPGGCSSKCQGKLPPP